MQLQLSLKIADRLHHDLLVRGEPIGSTEAARLLLSTSAYGAVPLEVLDTLVRDDRRFCWTGTSRESLALRCWRPDDADLSTVPFVALDLETTGAKAGPGKITEIGAVRIEGLDVVGEFHSLVNPQRVIPPMITHITGITNSMVADAPRIEELIPRLLDFLDGAVVVAHNAPFDVGFLNYELHRLGSRRLGDGAIDTLPLSRVLLPGLENYRLRTVAESLGSPVTACHRALEDARAVAHVFVHLARVLQERGLDSLDSLRQHGRSSVPAALNKLPLTRDLPESPGIYTFRGEEDQVLLIGSAVDLASEVRAAFLSGLRRNRQLRTAVRLLESVGYEQAATPLEALVREHDLSLEQRPKYNPYRIAPESYHYIRAGGNGPGLTLRATRTEPRWLKDMTSLPPGHELLIGPFRRRSSAQAAISLLHRCYPIRHCPRRGGPYPCERGESGLCLAPCSRRSETLEAHDSMIRGLMAWLAGGDQVDGYSDPLQRVAEIAHDLQQEGEHEQAQAIAEAREHLIVVRRACAALADARGLDFIVLWPQRLEGQASVRLNLVMGGVLQSVMSLSEDTVETQLTELLDRLTDPPAQNPMRSADALIAVPQRELDRLLAIRRWFHESDHNAAVIISLQDKSPGPLTEARTQTIARARALFER